MNGFGQTPIASTASATTASSQNSRPLKSGIDATPLLATAPNITRLYIHSVYAAPRIMIVAAVKPSQKFTLIDARTTRNSPTNPEVAGYPELAIEKSIMKAANFGIVLTTP